MSVNNKANLPREAMPWARDIERAIEELKRDRTALRSSSVALNQYVSATNAVSQSHTVQITETVADLGTTKESLAATDAVVTELNTVVLPALQTDLTAAQGEITALETVTIPALNAELGTAKGDISNLNTVTIPALNTELSTAKTELSTLGTQTIPALRDSLAGKGRVWSQSATPPNGAVYTWAGAANGSESVQTTDGVETRRNLSTGVPFNRGSGATAGTLTRHTSGGVFPFARYDRLTFETETGVQGASSNLWAPSSLDRPTVVPGQVITSSVYIRASIAQPVRVRIQSLNSSGGSAGSFDVRVTLVPGEWTRVSHVGIVMPETAASFRMYVDAGSSGLLAWPAGSTLDISGLLYEAGPTLRDFFNGDAPDDRQYDLWIDETNGDNIQKRWNGAGWTVASDKRFTTLASELSTAKSEVSAAQGEINTLNNTTIPALNTSLSEKLPTATYTSNKTATDTRITNTESVANGANTLVQGWKVTGKTTIDGGKIEADSVKAAQIAAGSITATKVVLQSNSSMIPWNIQTTTAPHQAYTGTTLLNALDADTGWIMEVRGGTGTDGTLANAVRFASGAVAANGLADDFDVEPGATYRFRVGVGIGGAFPSGIAREFRVAIALFKRDGTNTWFNSVIKSDAPYGVTTTYPTAMSFLDFQFTVPADVFSIRPFFQKATWSGGSYFVGEPLLTRATSAELIVDGSITADKIITNGVTADKINANAVTAGKIEAGAVISEKIATDAVTANKIIAGAVTTEKMTANTINGDRIAANTLNASKIVAGSITTDRMTANTINGDRITANTLNASKIVAGSITTDRMTANTINGDRITADTLNASKIVAGSITTDRMTVNSINGDRIAVNSLNADRIVANSITADKIDANAINGKTITGATIQSAATGKRTVLNASGIEFAEGSEQFPGSMFMRPGNYGVLFEGLGTELQVGGGGPIVGGLGWSGQVVMSLTSDAVGDTIFETDVVKATKLALGNGTLVEGSLPTAVVIGSSNAVGGADRWPNKLAAERGWTVHNYAIGGSGYFTLPTEQRFRFQVANAVAGLTQAQREEVGYFFVCDASNDARSNTTYANVKSEADVTYSMIRQNFPYAKIVVLPLVWPSDTAKYTPSAWTYDPKWVGSALLAAQAQRDALQAYPNSLFIDQSWTWLTGRDDLMLATADVHPNAAGHTLIMHYINRALNGELIMPETGWVDLPVLTGYTNGHRGRPLAVKRRGWTVTVEGSSLKSAAISGFAEYGVIPYGFRPTFETNIMSMPSDAAGIDSTPLGLHVYPAGNIRRYVTTGRLGVLASGTYQMG